MPATLPSPAAISLGKGKGQAATPRHTSPAPKAKSHKAATPKPESPTLDRKAATPKPASPAATRKPASEVVPDPKAATRKPASPVVPDPKAATRKPASPVPETAVPSGKGGGSIPSQGGRPAAAEPLELYVAEPVPPPLPDQPSEGAVYKRLWRLTKAREDGSYLIPEAIRNDWNDKEKRPAVVNLFERCAWDVRASLK